MTATSPYAIDASRVFSKRVDDPSAPYDTTAPDAVWVAVVGRTLEDVMCAAAKSDAQRYVVERFGQGDGVDVEEPPVPDTGDNMPLAITVGTRPDSRVTMSADEYMHAAARLKLAPQNEARYVAFYRVRRIGLM